MSHKSITDALETLVSGLGPFLFGMGFSQNKKRTFQKETNECRQELIIQFRRIKGQDAGYVEVCPNFTFEKVEKVKAILTDEKYKKGWPTAAANIGNLQSKREFLEWFVALDSDMDICITTISSLVISNALPFWNSFSNLDNLIIGYEKSDPRLTLNGNNYKWRLAAAYCIKREYDKAISTLVNWSDGKPSNSVIENSIHKIMELDINH